MSPAPPCRGHIYRADLGYGLKPWVVVSNNSRNRHIQDILAVRATTTHRDLPTWVELAHNDPITGYINADNIETLGKDELHSFVGALSVQTLTRLNRALAIALGLPD